MRNKKSNAKDLPKISQELFIQAYTIRRVEQNLLDLFTEGKIAGTIHTCVGQEFCGLALSEQLIEGDTIVSNHRCHGHYIARYKEYDSLIAEILGKPSGICRGYGGSQHIHREGFFSSGIQGGMTAASVGIALSKKNRRLKNIVVCYIGDGTLGEGLVYESLNLAKILQVPILFVLENNRYSQSTAQSETLAGTIEGRAKAFDLNYFQATTFEPEALLETAHTAVDYVRSQGQPAFLRLDTYRLGPHSKGDDNRNPKEIKEHQKKDPLNLFLDAAQNDAALTSKLNEIDKSIQSSIQNHLKEEQNLEVSTNRPAPQIHQEFVPVKSSAEKLIQTKLINEIFHRFMDEDSQLMHFGEDTKDPYGGTFKVTKGLSDKHPGRVHNMPISEAAITGIALGYSLTGCKAIAELMFGDFTALAFDQIFNHAAKFQSMYSEPLKLPLIMRTPMGGKKGYGATHSQSLEKFLYGIPGLDLFMLHPRTNVKQFYQQLLENVQRPSFVAENKNLYTLSPNAPLPENYALFESKADYPATRLKPVNAIPDITVISFGGIGHDLEQAMSELQNEEVFLDVFYPLKINGQEVDYILDSLKETNKILFLEEGTEGLSLSNEYLSQVFLKWDKKTQLPAFRVLCSLPRAIPAAKELEDQVIPNSTCIAEKLLELFDE